MYLKEMKKILMLLFAFFLVGSVLAQNESKHEFSLFGAFGMSTIKYSSSTVVRGSGTGGTLGLGYNYSLNKQWSLKTGLELSTYSSAASFSNYPSSYPSNDGQYDFDFRTIVSNYREKQGAKFLSIPLQAQFQSGLLKRNLFYTAVGFKLALPLSADYNIENTEMKNSGFYPVWSGEEDLVLSTQKFMGFGAFKRKGLEAALDFKPACIAALEAGIKWQTRKTSSVYTAVYFDLGLNDIKKGEKNLVQYNAQDPENFDNNSVLETDLTEKIRPMAFGLKLGFTFGGGI